MWRCPRNRAEGFRKVLCTQRATHIQRKLKLMAQQFRIVFVYNTFLNQQIFVLGIVHRYFKKI